MRIIETLESQVRSYVRSFPAVFDRAEGATLWDDQGNEYIDFFGGAGTLNYGHNHPVVSKALIKYLEDNRIVHGLDKATIAKRDFLQSFNDVILQPRNMDYKIQFTGPTGTNAVETALKIARMIKGRSNIIAFTNGYHGLTLGALAVTGNYFYRDESYGDRANVDHLPFDGYLGPDVDTSEYLRRMLEDNGSGIDLPAAVILETVQGEGGINVASNEWLRNIETICREYDILLIVDDIQMGNGRTGTFFSFEESGINPDIITLSKSIGGGLPMAITMLKPELDQWEPGEHTGTFRGNNLAFEAAKELMAFWENDDLSDAVFHKGGIIKERLDGFVKSYPGLELKIRGRGMAWGMEFGRKGFAGELAKKCFENKLILETCGSTGNVAKLLMPLVIDVSLMEKGLDILEKSIEELLDEKNKAYEGNNL